MDAPLHGHPPFPPGGAGDPTPVVPSEPSSSRAADGAQLLKRKVKKKKQTVVSESASVDSTSNCSSAASYSKKGVKIAGSRKRIRVGPQTAGRRNAGLSDVDALGLPLGMSIAAVIAQGLAMKNAAGENKSVDYLYTICGPAVRESLENVFGDKFNNFVTNFETSFRSTLRTLKLISSQRDGEQLERERFGGCSCSISQSNVMSHNKESACPREDTERESCTRANSIEQQERAGYQGIAFEASSLSSHFRTGDSACLSSNTYVPVAFPDRQSYTHSEMEENMNMNSTSQQLVLHDKRVERQLSCASTSNQFPMLSTMERSVMEQTRSNDLKTFKIGLIMKKIELKERQLQLNSTANILERLKLSMGISKASFKVEKFKTQLQDAREIELLKTCLDFLVGGLIIMLFSLAYGTYVYSHRRIVEASEACSPYTGSKSWWMPNAMSSFNSGLQLLKCQAQVFIRMLFGVLMIGAIAVVLIKRSSSSHQAMPITFILLLLGVVCGCAGRFCIDTLGGSGNHWLMYWEALCLLHFFSNIFHSTLYTILNGPIVVAEAVYPDSVFPYWMRRLLFYAVLLFLPLLCGFMPFAGPWDWFNHFSSMAADFFAA